MVRYVGVRDAVRLVKSIGIESAITGLASYIEADFRRWPLFDKSARIASHSQDGVIELMPTSDGEHYAFKYVNGHPTNTSRGLSTVAAFGVLSDVLTGYPLMLSEMTIATALRTAATSALAARYLARENASTMAMIGLGAQSEFQAHAFRAMLQVDKLRIFDIDAGATAKFMHNMDKGGFEITVCSSAAESVIGADIVTTVTAEKTNATILTDNMVGSGVHINAVGGDCPGKTEIHRDILKRASVFVEFPEQTRTEGEIQQMGQDFPVTELWRVIAGQSRGRASRDEITLFDSVGFAIEDFSTLRYIFDQTDGTDFHSDLDLLTELQDPKDLFGLVSTGRNPLRHTVASQSPAFA